MKNLESQEQKLAERKKKFRDESDGFDKDQEVTNKGYSLNYIFLETPFPFTHSFYLMKTDNFHVNHS